MVAQLDKHGEETSLRFTAYPKTKALAQNRVRKYKSSSMPIYMGLRSNNIE